MNYDDLASKKSIKKTIASLIESNHLPEFVQTRKEALELIKNLIPKGASVMNSSSLTLDEIGFFQYLEYCDHGWNNLHKAILAEKDQEKQAALRKQSVLSDFYLCSAHAISETGEIVIASNSGSQLPHLTFSSQNLIIVVGAQKITPDLDSAIARLKEYVLPLEDKRIKEAGNPKGSFISKMLIINRESPFMGRKSHIIFVNEKLGF